MSPTLKKGREKGKPKPQNEFEILASRVMKCRVKLRSQETKIEQWEAECYKYREKRHKYREYLLWRKTEKGEEKKRVAHVAKPQKVQQKKLRRREEKEAACVVRPQGV